MTIGDITQDINAGRAGAISKSAPYQIVGKVCDADMTVGVAVAPGATDESCKVPASAADVDNALGVAVYHPFRQVLGAGGEEYADGQVADVMIDGEIWVVVEEAVSPGDPVFCRHTANGGNTTLGAFRTDADTSNAAAFDGARFASTTSGAGIAKLRLKRP